MFINLGTCDKSGDKYYNGNRYFKVLDTSDGVVEIVPLRALNKLVSDKKLHIVFFNDKRYNGTIPDYSSFCMNYSNTDCSYIIDDIRKKNGYLVYYSMKDDIYTFTYGERFFVFSRQDLYYLGLNTDISVKLLYDNKTHIISIDKLLRKKSCIAKGDTDIINSYKRNVQFSNMCDFIEDCFKNKLHLEKDGIYLDDKNMSNSDHSCTVLPKVFRGTDFSHEDIRSIIMHLKTAIYSLRIESLTLSDEITVIDEYKNLRIAFDPCYYSIGYGCSDIKMDVYIIYNNTRSSFEFVPKYILDNVLSSSMQCNIYKACTYGNLVSDCLKYIRSIGKKRKDLSKKDLSRNKLLGLDLSSIEVNKNVKFIKRMNEKLYCYSSLLSYDSRKYGRYNTVIKNDLKRFEYIVIKTYQDETTIELDMGKIMSSREKVYSSIS